MKSITERLFAFAALVVTSPILALAAAAIAREDGRPVLFTQRRVGRGAKCFEVVKLRTMIRDADTFLDSKGVPTQTRVTRVGRHLRRYGIDELPQLWNVMIGEMAIVGPRPMLPELLDHRVPRDHTRFSVLPGITGSAQVAGRNAVPWSRRLELDTWYAEHHTIWVDLMILAQTARVMADSSSVASDRNPDQVMDLGRHRQS